MKMYTRLIYERRGIQGEALWLTLNNEKMMNALDTTMQGELHEVLVDTAGDNGIRCVVIRGAGGKAFCSGADISAMNPVTGYDCPCQQGNSIRHLITSMEKPVIAAVDGICHAGGLELALLCDFIYATQNSSFGLPEIHQGFLDDWSGTVRLMRSIPERRAREMIYRGEMINATEAHRLGLVNRIFFNKEAMEDTLQKAVAEITDKPPLALRAAKNFIDNSLNYDSIEAALSIERESICCLMASEDVKKGIAAAGEKRTPIFKGR